MADGDIIRPVVVGDTYVFEPIGTDALYPPPNATNGDLVIVTKTTNIGISTAERADTHASIGLISNNSLRDR